MLPNVKSTVEKLYTDRFFVISQRATEKDGITEFEDVKSPECVGRLSYKRKSKNGNLEDGSLIDQGIALYCDPSLAIKEGSIIEVVGKGRYKLSGKPAIYANHQEIILEVYRERA